MMKKTKFTIFLIAVFFCFAVASFALAQTGGSETGGGGPGGSETGSCPPNTQLVAGKCLIKNPADQFLVGGNQAGEFGFDDLIIQIIRIALYFAGAIALIFLIIGGFQYIAARGNEEAMEKAKKTITGAVIGVVIIIMSYAIVTIVNDLVVRGAPSGSGTTANPPPPGGNTNDNRVLTSPSGNQTQLTFTFVTQSPTCISGQTCDDSITIGTVSGGTAPYAYTLDRGFLPIGANLFFSENRLILVPHEQLDEPDPSPGERDFTLTIRDSASPPRTTTIPRFTLSVE